MAKSRKKRFNIFGKKSAGVKTPEDKKFWSEEDEGGSSQGSGSGQGSLLFDDDDEGGSGGYGKTHLGNFNREKLLNLIDEGKFKADLFDSYLNKDFISKDDLSKTELQKQTEAELDSSIDGKADKTAATQDAKASKDNSAWKKSPAADKNSRQVSSSFLDSHKNVNATAKAGSFSAAREISRRLASGESVAGLADHVGTVKSWNAHNAGRETLDIMNGAVAGTVLGTQTNHQGFTVQQVRGGTTGSLFAKTAKTEQGQTLRHSSKLAAKATSTSTTSTATSIKQNSFSMGTKGR